jgi:phosphoribosylglycinamide formyltransferase-1
MNRYRIAIFASGEGSNAENITNYFRGYDAINVVLIVSNRADVGVIQRAKRLKVPYLISPKDELNSLKFLHLLKQQNINIIILAGFLLKIPTHLISAFAHRIINIHPALLPKYGGKGMYGNKIHKAVLTNKEKESGITIHLVNEHYDKGEILFQKSCKVMLDDDVSDLAQRIHLLEYQFFPKIIEDYINSI